MLNRNATKRAAMLDAGIAELAEHGLAGASMQAIATGAGVAKRTLYTHFPSKEAVLEGVLARLIERIDPLSRLHYDGARGFSEQLHAVGQHEMQPICAPEFIRLSRVLMVKCVRFEAQSKRLMQPFGEKENRLYHFTSFRKRARQPSWAGSRRTLRPTFPGRAEVTDLLVFNDRVGAHAQKGGAGSPARRSLPDFAGPPAHVCRSDQRLAHFFQMGQAPISRRYRFAALTAFGNDASRFARNGLSGYHAGHTPASLKRWPST